MFITRTIKKIFRKRMKRDIRGPVDRRPAEDGVITPERINARLEKLEAELEKAVSGYRLLLIKENPDVLPELINGENIEALDRSLAAGRELTARVQQQIEKRLQAERIPNGAPVRTAPDAEGLSSYEKIRYGLDKKF